MMQAMSSWPKRFLHDQGLNFQCLEAALFSSDGRVEGLRVRLGYESVSCLVGPPAFDMFHPSSFTILPI